MFDTAKLMHIADCVLDGEDEVIVRDAVDAIVRLHLANKQSMAQADLRSAENVKLRQENERLRAIPRQLRDRHFSMVHTDMVGDDDRREGYLEALRDVERDHEQRESK